MQLPRPSGLELRARSDRNLSTAGQHSLTYLLNYHSGGVIVLRGPLWNFSSGRLRHPTEKLACSWTQTAGRGLALRPKQTAVGQLSLLLGHASVPGTCQGHLSSIIRTLAILKIKDRVMKHKRI